MLVLSSLFYLSTEILPFSFNFITLITPLIGSLYLFFNGFYLGTKGSPLIAIFCIFISWFSCTSWLFSGFFFIELGHWFSVGLLSIHWSFTFNSLSWIMCFIVSTVSLVVHIFSFFYMYKDPHINRFFCYLNLFTFFMLFLIVSNNLILMFWGWEGVGICSYLLINFWYTRIAANKSALKAVFINKLSDIFLLYGILLIIIEFNTTEIPVILALVPFFKYKVLYCCGFTFFLLDIISLFLTLGSFGKSAQLGFHLWLPDAMEGPTPVSALIHAATMVTAGVFLLLRLSLFFDYSILILKIVLFVGSFTALISSLIGSFQYDIKKIIAYSTCSQLGYMFVSCGFSNYSLSLFHLFNHAFFKSLLFLSSGLVIHALYTQDIRKFEKKKITNSLIYLLFLIPSFSLCGFPFLSGSFSKENIIKLSLYNSFIDGDLIYFFLLVTAAITSFYSIKLLYYIYSPKKTYVYFLPTPLLFNTVSFLSLFYSRKKKKQEYIKKILKNSEKEWKYPYLWYLHVFLFSFFRKYTYFYLFLGLIFLPVSYLSTIKLYFQSLISFLNFSFLAQYFTLFFKKNLLLYLPLFLLLLLSILSGFFFQDIFIGISSNFFLKDLNSNFIYKLDFFSIYLESFLVFKNFFPFILSFFFFFFFDLFNFFFKYNSKLYYFIKFKFFFDFLYNFISIYFLKLNFNIVFKSIDKGFLEILGPNGFTRHSFWMIKYIRYINKDLIFNYICLFLFFLTYTCLFF